MMEVLLVAFTTASTCFGATVLYGFVLDGHPAVVEMRRITVWHVLRRYPWPSNRALPAMLPFGLGGLMALAGRAVAGRTATFEGFPWDAGQDLLMLGVALIFVGMWFLVLPPKWALPSWYRDAIARLDHGLDPDMPAPKGGSDLFLSRRQRRMFLAAFILILIATPALSLPWHFATGAIFGLALVAVARVR